jgi:methylated-DNA-[protein]-cysteine S-methyltransferase
MNMDYTAHYDSPLGGITLASDGKRLAGLWFDGQKYFADVLDKEHEEKPDIDVFDKTRRWLDEYFCGREPQFTPPLVFRGSDFRKRVWQRLMQIPYGHTETYGDIARSLGCHSAQAVGGAVGHNPLTLIAPCHRVMGSDGSLTGYAGGIDKKIRLLQLEGGKEPVEMTPGIVMSFKPGNTQNIINPKA